MKRFRQALNRIVDIFALVKSLLFDLLKFCVVYKLGFIHVIVRRYHFVKIEIVEDVVISILESNFILKFFFFFRNFLA